MDLEAIELDSAPSPRTSLIILHGLGADGSDFLPVCEALDVSAIGPVHFVLPSAPVMPVSLNGGFEMRAWYDIVPTADGGRSEDEASLRRAQVLVSALIDREIARGIAPERIVLMGFSQGCAMTLLAGLRHPRRLGGLVALSGYLPLAATTEAERHPANQATPIFMAHGDADDVVDIARGQAARDTLTRLGYRVDWRDYPMAHSLCLEEVRDLNAWLVDTLGAGLTR